MTAGTRPNDKEKVRDHYDRMSPYYHSLWGEHIHHGYWIRGDESKETAQVQLIEHLAQAAGIQSGDRILDVGCGFGELRQQTDAARGQPRASTPSSFSWTPRP